MCKSLLLASLLLVLLPAAARAQAPVPAPESEPEAGFDSRWYLGPAYRYEGLLQGISDQLWGFQVYHQIEPHFGTGGGLYFSPQTYSLAFDLSARWRWDLPVVAPYAGAQLGYLSQYSGGLSLALQPGLQIEIPGVPVLLDIYGLLRYDVADALFGSQDPVAAAYFGLGSSLLFKLPE